MYEAFKKYMIELIKDNPASQQALFRYDITLYRMVKNGKINIKEALDGVLETFIVRRLNFPEAEDLIEMMDVTYDYYDVSDELLNENEEFAQILEELKNSKDTSDELKIRKFMKAYKENE